MNDLIKDKLSKEQIDAIKEVVSIGAGNAATALSQIVEEKVEIKVPNVRFVKVDESQDLFGSAEEIVGSVYLKVLGDAEGVILFAFVKNEALRLADLIMNQPVGSSKVINEMVRSALKEGSSILTGSYLNAISKLLDMRFIPTIPSFAQDMAGAIISDVLIESCKGAEYAIVFDTEFRVGDEQIFAYFFFVPEKQFLDLITEKLFKK